MKTEMELLPAKNPNPVLIVAKDGTVLYSNEAGEPLLYEWGAGVGEKLPSCIGDFVQRVISRNIPEKMEVKVGNKVYFVSFHPSLEEECVNIYGFNISDQKEIEEKLRIKEKQTDVLYKIGKNSLEYESLQIFMDKSLKLIASILEQEYCKIMELMPDGNFLLRAGIGWKPEFVGKHVVGGEKGSQAGYTLFSRTPVIVDDFAEENRFEKPEILKIHGVVSGASVVIGSMEKIYGVLVVNSTKKKKFTTDDTYFLNSVAFLIAQVVERKRAEEALKEAHDRLEEKVKERTTQLEKAYNSLKESEKSLSEAQRMAHIGNRDWNLVTGEIHLSDEMYRIFGLDPKESDVIYDELLNYVHPDDRGYVDNAFQRGLKGEPFGIDYRIILANGEERTVHTQIEVIFDEKNTPVRMRETLQDITERKTAEEKIQSLANIVESSNDAIGTLSLEGIITSWNEGAEQVYGYSAEEVLGEPISILAPSHLDEETKKLSEGIKKGENIHQYETIRLKKDGKIIDVSINLSPVFDVPGNLTAISFVVRDITERKQAERFLTNIETARKKEIHHRIKNNLQVISSLLDLQAEMFRDRGCVEDSEVLSAFRESQDRVISIALIHEELHEGRGTDTLNFSPYLERLVNNLFQTYRLGNVNTSLNIELEEDIFFDMDIAVPLGIIINELVSNSLKYAFIGRDKGLIQIKLCRKESTECTNNGQGSKKEGYNGTNFTLTVLDNGIGILEDFNSEDSGSLGLQLVAILVDQLGGELELKRDTGTEFIIRFVVTEKNEQIEPKK
jgi:PAS domain S-box-containing protein